MKTKIIFNCWMLFVIISGQIYAQTGHSNIDEVGGTYPIFYNNALHPCITEEQYREIEYRCNENIRSFNLNKNLSKESSIITLNWPLQADQDLKECSYFYISAHVDHDNTSGSFKDYNCGSLCYDAHRGTDIAIGPFPFYKMDHDAVEVIAAASGTLIDKHDGEFDKNCSGVSSSAKANYVVIQHADASRAIYFHMKSGRITTKAIGQNIAAGEVIGIVGSSGYSSGPHLHFEIWSGSTVSTLVDPFSGNCNAKNTQTWWANQKTYKEPDLIQASVHTTDVVIPACPMTELPNQTQTFTLPFQGPGLPAGFAKFYIFLKNETNGKVVEMSILNPDKTIFTSWTRTSNNDSKFSFWGYSKKLPTVPGQYTFMASYNGSTCTQTFEVKVPAANFNLGKDLTHVEIYPNPFNLSTNITVPLENEVVNYTLLNSMGQKVKSGSFSGAKTHEIFREELPSGLYLFLLDIQKTPIGSAQLILVD